MGISTHYFSVAYFMAMGQVLYVVSHANGKSPTQATLHDSLCGRFVYFALLEYMTVLHIVPRVSHESTPLEFIILYNTVVKLIKIFKL